MKSIRLVGRSLTHVALLFLVLMAGTVFADAEQAVQDSENVIVLDVENMT